MITQKWWQMLQRCPPVWAAPPQSPPPRATLSASAVALVQCFMRRTWSFHRGTWTLVSYPNLTGWKGRVSHIVFYLWAPMFKCLPHRIRLVNTRTKTWLKKEYIFTFWTNTKLNKANDIKAVGHLMCVQIIVSGVWNNTPTDNTITLAKAKSHVDS